MITTRQASDNQEKQIAKLLNGKVQSNSGGCKFGGGDVHTKQFFIEAKTTLKEKTSFSIKKEWIAKAKEQAFEQNKPYHSLAFQFEPDGENYFIINEKLMQQLIELTEVDDV